MFKYAFLMVSILTIAVAGCRSTFENRINKDIVGINEQLYDLEKEQIKTAQQLQDLKSEATRLMKKEKEQSGVDQNKPNKEE